MSADAEGAREYVDPEITMGEPPGARVCEPTMNCEALFSVMGCPPMVIMGADGVAPDMPARELVSPLMMIADADGAREYVVPDITIAEEPGARVWLLTRY